MKTYKFKTNINCGSCVSKVSPFLKEKEGIHSWKVNTTVKDKILEVKADEKVSGEEIIKIIEEAGFKAEKANKGFLGGLLGS